MLAEETIFLTGFPGFIASRLLRCLAGEGARFLLLVQPAFAQRAQEELQSIAEQAGRFSQGSFRVNHYLSPGGNL